MSSTDNQRFFEMFFKLFASFVLTCSTVACVFAEPAPATTTTAATTQRTAQITPQAAEVLAKVKQAYTSLKSFQHTGKITGDFDVDGQQQKEAMDFAASFSAPNLFRLELNKDDQIGSNGQRMYVYLKQRNMFLTADAPKDRAASQDLPEPFADLIHSQDPSLGLAISTDPAAELARSRSVARVEDVKLGETSFIALKTQGQDVPIVTTMLVDPQTHLLRRVTIDLTADLKRRGAGEVKKAEVTIDYPSNNANPTTHPDQFAWAPPAGARDAADMQGGGEAEQLVGKPAPAFKLKDLNDKEVALADFKGKVLVLDFWATWCGPCVFSLPKIDALATEMKDSGAVFYTINQGEEKDLAQGFMASKNLKLPVLLDSDFKVSESYFANSIPQTVVIDKNGIVRKVFVGVGPDTEARLRDAINAALNAAK
jgi:peroxiredoxin/outer membrane lipoprotein-sorting protein